MHVIPIIVQDTPPDYYFATPLGVILYSILVQALFSFKKNRKIFLSLFGLNILMLIYFIPFLKMNDPESGRHLASLVNEYWYFFGRLHLLASIWLGHAIFDSYYRKEHARDNRC